MSKAIVTIDIPTDYADEYKQWAIDGRLYYLEDGAWTVLKDVQYGVELYKDAIPVEFIEEQIAKTTDINNRDELDVLYAGNLGYLLKLWEEENGKSGNSD